MLRVIRQWLSRFPRARAALKRIRAAFFKGPGVSSGYIQMAGAEALAEAARLRGAWQANELPGKQRELADHQLARYRAGHPVDVFDVLVRSVKPLTNREHPATVLEIGCSSGYYSDVFSIAGLSLVYSGCDYSDAFVGLARKIYPHLQFDREDATSLGYPDTSFDVVISGCCLLHIPEYEAAIAETARVARRYAIFHRTPVMIGQPTKYFRKLAYGIETVEIHFNETEFLGLLAKYGLRQIEVHTLNEEMHQGMGIATRTYVCCKTNS